MISVDEHSTHPASSVAGLAKTERNPHVRENDKSGSDPDLNPSVASRLSLDKQKQQAFWDRGYQGDLSLKQSASFLCLMTGEVADWFLPILAGWEIAVSQVKSSTRTGGYCNHGKWENQMVAVGFLISNKMSRMH
ncbi:hypothetical protein RRG08_056830 [Elysia crispata]|uniref:Uncharacterized protein n=1 Tax=Elysia crispata TaxID=231223 RepID=A0AAE1DWF3_9GAST|nr:hypothetical protein RRG08_056830 [Elysia crispata]